MKYMPRAALSLALSVFAAQALSAQVRLSLPEGSVIIVRTQNPLESNTARTGQTFETIVVDSVGVDNYNVIPSGSRIRGVVTFAQPATRQQSGVIEVNFDRLTLPDGQAYTIDGKLTSTDAAERRQIDSDPNARVVLVGGRGGIGAGIAGAGSEQSPASSILAALGGLLSSAQDVRVPAGTPLAVQLEQGVMLNRRGTRRTADAFTIYTDAAMIRAAQQALSQQGFYRGQINGRLDDNTQRALFDYQVARGMVATGNLNGRTARALGISATGGTGTGGSMVLSPNEAGLVKRAAQALVTRQRQELSVSSVGGLSTRRTYAEGDVELWFALSAFDNNAALYEQLVRGSGNNEGAVVAGRSLIGAARRVDAALQRTRSSFQIQNAWTAIRRQLATIDASYASQ